ncbi:hypothetical protein D3C71_456040 [compost metagenome]
MHVQDLFTAADIGQADGHLTVETARTQQRFVEHVGAVGGGHDDHAGVRFKTVHLDQQLVQGLFALIIAAAHAGAAVTANSVDLIDEDDARRMLFRVFKHVAHAAGTDADEHFHEVGTGNREERHLGFAGDGARQQGFTRARRTDHQHAAGNAAAQFLEFARVLEEVDHFVDFFFRFVATGDIGEGDGVAGFIHHARLRLAERECPALAAALHLTHEEYPHADQQQHGEPGNKNSLQERRFLRRTHIEMHAIVAQVADQALVEAGGGGTHLGVVHQLGGDRRTFDHDILDALGFDFIQQIGISDGLAAACGAMTVELLEQHEQQQQYDYPDGRFGKHVIHEDSLDAVRISLPIARNTILLAISGPCQSPPIRAREKIAFTQKNAV